MYQNKRTTFRLGDKLDTRLHTEINDHSRYVQQEYVPQFELELVHENSLGRVVEVFDTKTDQIYYIAHKWTRPDRTAFCVVGKAISLGDAQSLLRLKTAEAYAKETAEA